MNLNNSTDSNFNSNQLASENIDVIAQLPSINDSIRTNIIFSIEIYKKINNFEHNYIHEYINNYEKSKNSK